MLKDERSPAVQMLIEAMAKVRGVSPEQIEQEIEAHNKRLETAALHFAEVYIKALYPDAEKDKDNYSKGLNLFADVFCYGAEWAVIDSLKNPIPTGAPEPGTKLN